MNKKYSLLVFALIISLCAQAQSNLIGLTKARYDGSTDFTIIGDTAWYMYSGTNDTSNAGALAYDSSYLLTYLNGFTTGNFSYRYYQTMDGHNNIATILSQTYDTPSTSWINYQNKQNVYDANNNPTLNLLETWDNTGLVWDSTRKTMNTFSGNNNTIKIVQLWNTTSNAWRNSTKDSFSYNISNNLLYHLAQTWDTTNLVWINANQYTYTYNTNLVATSIRQIWNTVTLAWQNVTNTMYDYNANNFLSNTIVQNWDTVASANIWVNSTADTVTYYGTTGNKFQETNLRWDTTFWLNRTLNVYTYDANNNALSDTTYTWSAANSIFNYTKLKTYTYNTHNQPLVYTTATWSATNTAWYYRTTGSAANQDVQYRYYYGSGIPNGVNTVSKNNNSLMVFPNPASDLLNIKIDWDQNASFAIEIFDMNGSLMRRWNETPQNKYTKQIVVNDLPAGNYIIKAISASSHLTQKFLIVR